MNQNLATVVDGRPPRVRSLAILVKAGALLECTCLLQWYGMPTWGWISLPADPSTESRLKCQDRDGGVWLMASIGGETPVELEGLQAAYATPRHP